MKFSEPLSLKTLHLNNYRCFKSIKLDLHDRLTVLVAQNGGGKTAILDAIAVAMGPFVGAFDEGQGCHFEPTDIQLRRVRKTNSNEMEYAPDGVELGAIFNLPEPGPSLNNSFSFQQVQRKLSGPKKSRTTIGQAKSLVQYAKHLQRAVRNGQAVTLPLTAYYGTGRLWKTLKLVPQKIKATSRTIGYSECLNPGSTYKMLVEWFQYWQINDLAHEISAITYEKEKVPIPPNEFKLYLSAIRGAVNKCLETSGWEKVEYSLGRQELVAHHKKFGELPISLLSDGIRNMIAMVADIAFRAVKLNPHFGENAVVKTPGIVLIDEVDMHLHPEWQQSVIKTLQVAFPKIQFIVSTHSPQVLTTVPSECIRLLNDNQVFGAPAGTEGAESKRILEQVFGVPSRPPGIQATKYLQEYLDLLSSDMWNSPEAKKLRGILDENFQGEEPELLRADLYISNRKWEEGK